LRWLKRIRVVVAILFFLALTLLFLDIGNVVPIRIHTFFVSTQLVPSFMRTMVVLSSASFGLFFILAMTILFGRVYCSTLCPLGILQDIVIRIAKRINRRRRFRYKEQHYFLHYSLFILTGILAFSGSVILLNFFEPFSNYGRILSNLMNPFVVSVNNVIGYIFNLLGYMVLFQIPILHINLVSVLASLIFLALVAYLSYNHGRLFCNLLCPAGAFLGLLSRFSFFKIVIDKNNCKECGLCERVCKANCIKSGSKEIDFAACIGCFNCLDACPTIGMSYQRRWTKLSETSNEADVGRRNVLRISVLPALNLLLPVVGVESAAERIQNGFNENRKHPISPPGSLGVERFSSLCTACHLCVSSCPTQVLFPSFLEYGVAGVFQPKMNYNASYCNFDCVLCSQVCPTGAILPLDVSSKKEVQIGIVQFVKNDCIVVTKEKDCGACSEHCPTKAVHMVPYGKSLMIPETNNDICVGCGACEHVCPAQPTKAIYVKSNTVHQKALKPKTKKAEQAFDSSQEFPF
jgi:polyferredoxin/Fe-S-cluster-containing dehydrogenase component